MSYIPEPYHFALLALASWRLWKLIADDRISERPVNWLVCRRLAGKWGGELVDCPYCLGFWTSGLAYAIWLSILDDWPDTAGEAIGVLGVWFALSAAVGLIGTVWATLSKSQPD